MKEIDDKDKILTTKQKNTRAYKDKVLELKKDFRKFVFVIHKELNMQTPTPLQYDMCNVLQSGEKRLIIEAFRGCGKSHITSLYCLWQLYRNPNLRVLIVSASADRSYTFTTFIQKLILQIPLLKHLKPKSSQRSSKEKFDVGPAYLSSNQDASVVSIGIGGQLAGKRGDIIIVDDGEGTNNSETELKRERLLKKCEEFESIIVPEIIDQIVYLGTPQSESSIYNKLPMRGYKLFIWPAVVPTNIDLYKRKTYNLETKREEIVNCLAPFVTINGRKIGEPLEPGRFNKEYLRDKEIMMSSAGYALQFNLDTTLSDIEKYPLRLSDLIVYTSSNKKAPIDISHSSTTEFDFPNYGFDGDRLYKPSYVDTEFKDFEDIVMSIDPSGRGRDETAYSIVGLCHGKLYVLDVGGFLEPTAEPASLDKLSELIINYGVKNIMIESNFGSIEYNISGHLKGLGINAEIHTIHSSIQKEKRIIETLEPIMLRHHLVISEEVLKKEQKFLESKKDTNENLENDNLFTYKFEEKLNYSLLHQITRITYDRGALVHDDRLDSLVLACDYYKEKLDRNINRAKEIFKNRQRDEFVRQHILQHKKMKNGGKSSGSFVPKKGGIL